MREILRGIVSKNQVYRYNCFRVLLQISENEPLILYPEWDYSVELISSDNSYHRSASLQIMANLASVDTENRFENIFGQYFDLLDDSMITARYLARNAGRIAKSKPYLRARITDRLLDIDKTHHDHERKDLIIKADAIQSFEEFFEEAQDKDRILAFVEEQLGCSSPKTRKVAKGFLKKYDE